MDVCSAFVAGAESLEGVQPGEAALDHPALLAQSGAVGDATTGDPRSDAALPELSAVAVVVLAAVGGQLAAAPDRRHGVDQRDELGDVVAVAAGQ